MRSKLTAAGIGLALALAAILGLNSPVHANDSALASSIHLTNAGNWHQPKAPGGWLHGDSHGKKKSPAPTPFTGPGYYYAGMDQALTGTDSAGGMASKIYEATPFIPATSCVSGGDHSLMEMAMKDAAGNVTEFGWAAEPSAFGDCKPRLFASTWTGNGSGSGTWNGCYDAHAPSCWFIDNASNPINLGADLTATANLCNGSSLACVKQFQMYYSATTCGVASSGIFLVYDGATVGCFYSSAFYNHITPTAWQTFYVYGEYYYTGSTKPCGDMGNGITSSVALGNTGPAYFGSYSLANPSPSTLASNLSPLTSTDPLAYNETSYSGGSPPVTRTVAASGAGYTSSGGTPGVVKGC